MKIEINNEEIDISDLISQKYMHKKINDKLYLSDYQKSILDIYKIDYNSVSSAKELLFLIEDVLNEEEYEDLEEISKQISEFDYYHNTNK